MTKSPCRIHITNAPPCRTQDTRAHAAHILRAYRAKPDRYEVTRCSTGVYLVVHTNGFDLDLVAASGSSTVALIETR